MEDGRWMMDDVRRKREEGRCADIAREHQSTAER